jgi:hypothetical protein
MDHATLATAASGILGIGIGAIIGGFFAGAKHNALRATIAARDLTIEAKDRRIGLVHAENVRLKPHADAHIASVKQRAAALAKAREANAAKAAAKAGNVTSIVKPKRKRA